MNEDALDELIDQVIKAEEQALLNKIETNAIVLNDDFDFCEGFLENGLGKAKEVPPMILGKHVFKAKLPKGYSFALTYTKQQESDLEYYKRRCSELEEKLEKIKEELK